MPALSQKKEISASPNAHKPICLVLNADDLGVSPSVNKSIFDAANQGILKSASLLVGMPAAEEAVREIAKRQIPLTLGLHFCLTSGHPITPPYEVPLLVDSEGRFKRGFLGLARLLYFHRKETLAQIEKEWQAQLAEMDRLRKTYPSVRFDHIDSHQHIHVLPALISKLAQEADRRHWTLRIPRELIGRWGRVMTGSPIFRAKGIAKKMILDHFLFYHGGWQRQKTAPVYFGIVDSGRMTQEAILNILAVLPKIQKKTGRSLFEINLHPWRIAGERVIVSPDASQADHIFAHSPYREEEWKAACDVKIAEKMKELNIRPATFSEMTE